MRGHDQLPRRVLSRYLLDPSFVSWHFSSMPGNVKRTRRIIGQGFSKSLKGNGILCVFEQRDHGPRRVKRSFGNQLMNQETVGLGRVLQLLKGRLQQGKIVSRPERFLIFGLCSEELCDGKSLTGLRHQKVRAHFCPTLLIITDHGFQERYEFRT